MTQQYTAVPQPGYIIVTPLKSEELNRTELATLDDDREHISTGKVLAVSEYAGTYENYALQVSTDVVAGDIVGYIQYSESPLKLNGEELHLVRFDRITAKIVESK